MSTTQWEQMSNEAKFLGYNFIPTSLTKQHAAKHKLVLSLVLILIILVTIIGVGFGTHLMVDGDWSAPWNDLRFWRRYWWDWGFFGMVVLLLIITIIPVVLELIIRWYKHTPNRRKIADYVQKKRGYILFVKDGKFGVMNNYNNKILVPALYDKLTWFKKKKILIAELSDEQFLIDIHNNKLN